MGALWIAHVDVTDDQKYAEYIKVASVVIPEHGGHLHRARRTIRPV